jgi:predicted nucleic acid-binding protein
MAKGKLIISNTTRIINLAEIGRLDLLEKIFGKVVVPPAVVTELLAKQNLFPKAGDAAACFEVVHPEDLLLVRGFRSAVHAGEAECLALAMENPSSLLLLDDLQVRALASSNGLAFTGTLGLFVEAKARGLVDAVAPLIEKLRRSARFWISLELETRVLNDVGECPFARIVRSRRGHRFGRVARRFPAVGSGPR